MNYEQYYNGLMLPQWAPPSWLFGAAWPVLYAIILLSFGYVFYQIFVKHRWSKNLLLPFATNLVANALYTPLFFNWQLPWLALIDILVVLGSIIWTMKVMWNKERWVAHAQIPYLAWVGFATCLQIAIVLMNFV